MQKVHQLGHLQSQKHPVRVDGVAGQDQRSRSNTESAQVVQKIHFSLPDGRR